MFNNSQFKKVNSQEKIEFWKKWFEEIWDEAINLRHLQNVYKTIMDMIINNNALYETGIFIGYFRKVYAETVCIGVRRLCDKSKKTKSFLKLLKDMRQHPGIITRDYYVNLYEDEDMRSEFASSDFDDLVGKGRSHLSKKAILKDINLLQNKTSLIISFVNNYIAHRKWDELSKMPSYKDLDDSLDVIEHLICRYSQLLKATACYDLTPTIQGNWTQMFEVPWLIEEDIPD